GQRSADRHSQSLDRGRVLANQLRRQQGLDEVRRRDMILAAPDWRGRYFAQPDDPGVGMVLHEQELRNSMRAAPALDGALWVDRDAHRNSFDLRDFHPRSSYSTTYAVAFEMPFSPSAERYFIFLSFLIFALYERKNEKRHTR